MHLTRATPSSGKAYRWREPRELFANVLGLYVGWANEPLPQNVLNWGRSVRAFAVDKWNPALGEKGRWRDQEVVESIWSAIEDAMRVRNWGH